MAAEHSWLSHDVSLDPWQSCSRKPLCHRSKAVVVVQPTMIRSCDKLVRAKCAVLSRSETQGETHALLKVHGPHVRRIVPGIRACLTAQWPLQMYLPMGDLDLGCHMHGKLFVEGAFMVSGQSHKLPQTQAGSSTQSASVTCRLLMLASQAP